MNAGRCCCTLTHLARVLLNFKNKRFPCRINKIFSIVDTGTTMSTTRHAYQCSITTIWWYVEPQPCSDFGRALPVGIFEGWHCSLFINIPLTSNSQTLPHNLEFYYIFWDNYIVVVGRLHLEFAPIGSRSNNYLTVRNLFNWPLPTKYFIWSWTNSSVNFFWTLIPVQKYMR